VYTINKENMALRAICMLRTGQFKLEVHMAGHSFKHKARTCVPTDSSIYCSISIHI